MGFTPNRIKLIQRGRHEEAPALGSIYPGMLLAFSGSSIIPHNVEGGPPPVLVAIEDALRGADITQVLPTLNVTPYHVAAKGDKLLMLLQNGQNVGANVSLISAGDGTLIAAPQSTLYEIVAPSAALASFTTEVAFSNGTYVIPANFLQVGDRYHIRVKTFCVGVTATPNFTVKTYFGSVPTVIASSGAISQIANDVIEMDIWLTIRAITAAGTMIADGVMVTQASGTFTTTPFTLVSTTNDSTVANTVKVTAACSANSASNSIRLDEFQVNLERQTGMTPLFISQEAINNSAGAGSSPISGFNSAAFIRALVL
jgi:hypothetical protein